MSNVFVRVAKPVRTMRPAYRYRSDSHTGLFEIEMPGVTSENVSIRLHSNTVVIQGKVMPRPDSNSIVRGSPRFGEGKMDGDGLMAATTFQATLYTLVLLFPECAYMNAITTDFKCEGILLLIFPKRTGLTAKIWARRDELNYLMYIYFVLSIIFAISEWLFLF